MMTSYNIGWIYEHSFGNWHSEYLNSMGSTCNPLKFSAHNTTKRPKNNPERTCSHVNVAWHNCTERIFCTASVSCIMHLWPVFRSSKRWKKQRPVPHVLSENKKIHYILITARKDHCIIHLLIVISAYCVTGVRLVKSCNRLAVK